VVTLDRVGAQAARLDADCFWHASPSPGGRPLILAIAPPRRRRGARRAE
jgi:hypothetical protein